ncbi:MAG: hypothetical protein ND895_23340 [Pyrinomonadaceae bacterium]|nr:hypothetical protein [Pyrinomonadaceae bacterium]
MKRISGLILLVCLSLFGSQASTQRRATLNNTAPDAAYIKTSPVENAHAVPAREVMTDRCSAEVAIVPSFADRPDTEGTIILKRAKNGITDWTPPLTVKLGNSGHVRWWCHSTTGNAFDPGTWRIRELQIGTECQIFADGTPESCRPDGGIKLGTSAWNGWTPERSRCGNRSRNIRARLGPNRLLEIECLGQ